MKNKLTLKQEKFIDYYIESGNATEAAIKAGYNKKNARVIAAQNLSKLNIKKVIEEKRKELTNKSKVTKEWLIDVTKEVVERSLQKKPVMEFDKEDKVYRQKKDADGEGIWTYDGSVVVKAVERLSKMLGHEAPKEENVKHSGEIKTSHPLLDQVEKELVGKTTLKKLLEQNRKDDIRSKK